MSTLYIGVMSGTSLDGVDAVLADFSNGVRIFGHSNLPFDAPLQQTFLQLNQPGPDELHRAALAGNALAQLYAQAVRQLLSQTGVAASDVAAIGAHGQTVRHQPGQHDGMGYTLQINQPALLAELTAIRVVADFRSRDIAAGGQGAPLVPAFHQHLFAETGRTVAVLNIGGISNLSVLAPDRVSGFDCGPGNVLLDLWCQQHTGQAFDNNGAWAASGHCHPSLLDQLLSEPFLHYSPPKSTGRDLFHANWLSTQLQHFQGVSAVDVQATLTAFTAQVCVNDIQRHAPDASRLLVCGGGAYNGQLMQLLQQGLPQLAVSSTEAVGLPPSQVEAAAFAWLAQQTCLNLPGNLPAVTGALGPRVLGGIYAA
ncbi:MAG: anhydro-N-acetylmuramic acid kinase [Burkholderiales bacterium]|nr:anhydro-N-acetylmuramic acid kinase [Burkholderiales bacterium]